MVLVPKVPLQLIVGCNVSSSILCCMFRKKPRRSANSVENPSRLRTKNVGRPIKNAQEIQQACVWSSHRHAKTMLKSVFGSNVDVDETEASSGRTSAALVDLV